MEGKARLEVQLDMLLMIEAVNHQLSKSLVLMGTEETGYAIAGERQRKSIFRDIFPDGCSKAYIEEKSLLYNLSPLITDFCDFSDLAGSHFYPDLNKQKYEHR